MTSVKAGKSVSDGRFEPGSINDSVDKKLQEMAEKLKEFSVPEEQAKRRSEEA